MFGIVYLGMFLGGLPHFKLDRTGVALLGAIAMIAITGMPIEEAARSVDLPTIVLLFAFMVVSAQMRLGGFYAAVTRAVGTLPLARNGLLAMLIAVAAVLSAVFSNDVVCLAMTPVVAHICLERLPLSAALLEVTDAAQAHQWALSGGEDYELLLAVPPADLARLSVLAAQCGLRLTDIGECRAGEGVTWSMDGRPLGRTPAGFDHFR